eukprot:Gb_06239 [translate_table: standard]
MSRWMGGVGVGTATHINGWGALLLLGSCVLALIAVITALCASHSRRDDREYNTRGQSPNIGRSLRLNVSGPKSLVGKKILSTKGNCEDKEEEKEGGEWIWQRNIIMGERCQPPNFSGAIIYDDKGNRLPQFPPKSPRPHAFSSV